VREEERMEGKILDRSLMKRMREKGEFNFKKNLKSQMTKMPFKGKDVIVLR
jgi:serine protease inhibitor